MAKANSQMFCRTILLLSFVTFAISLKTATKGDKNVLGGEVRNGRSSAEWLELVGDRASKKTLPTGPGYVYIISKEGAPPGENNVKIGRSVDPDARRTQLQVGNDRPLVVSARYWVNNMLAAEAAAHDAMDQYRVHGEWFSLPPGGIARVKQIVSAAIGQK